LLIWLSAGRSQSLVEIDDFFKDSFAAADDRISAAALIGVFVGLPSLEADLEQRAHDRRG
jgi:hypothetical protein